MDTFSERLLFFCVWAGLVTLVKPNFGELGSQFEVHQVNIRMWLMKSIKHELRIVKADFGRVNSNT